MKRRLVAGSRQSPLALAQTHGVIDALKAQYGDLDIEVKTFKTTGDQFLEQALSKVGDKGLFVKELEVALLEGEIDFAVHSMKDMPGHTPEGLQLLTTGRRENPLDAFISAGKAFWDLPPGAVIGTSSLRRQALLSALRDDISFTLIRGNVQTRLGKVHAGEVDATLLAAAGLIRLGLEEAITHTFTAQDMTPACCQGTLAVEIADDTIKTMFTPLIDPATDVACQAERGFLATLEGGCQVPMAAFASHKEADTYEVTGVVCSLDGRRVLKSSRTFTASEATLAGSHVAKVLLDQGARDIIAACHSPS